MAPVARAALAIGTLGGSELVRKKPFQPGGEDTPLRTLAAVGSGGASELARNKPFQSGGKYGHQQIGENLRLAAAGLTLGATETARAKPFQPGGTNSVGDMALVKTGAQVGEVLVKPFERKHAPPLPSDAVRVAPSTETQAVQQASSEAARRRARARGFRSTILSQHMLAPTSPALQETFGS